MKIDRTNIRMIRGDSEGINIRVKDHAGLPVPLIEGDTVYFTVKDNAKTKVKRFQKVITEFIDGAAHVNIEPEDTQKLDFKTYVYDIQLTKADGTVKTIVPISNFIIGQEVSHE